MTTSIGTSAPAPRLKTRLHAKLSIVQVVTEPLRSRPEDIAPLAERFLLHSPYRQETSSKVLSRGRLDELVRYDWPGNVAELRLEMERLLLLEQVGRPDAMGPRAPVAEGQPVGWSPISLEQLEREHIARTLEAFNWTKSRAAGALGIERSTLDRKIKRYGMTRPKRRR